MTLIDQCQSTMVIISPYVKVRYWKKLTNRILNSQKRGVTYEWYYRAGEDYSREFAQLNIKGTPVEKLHCKIYYNEKQALVTSMNLHEYSDTYSIDIGYLTETKREYDEVLEFVELHVKPAQVMASQPWAALPPSQPSPPVPENTEPTLENSGIILYQSISSDLHLVTDATKKCVDEFISNGSLGQEQYYPNGRNIEIYNYCNSLNLIIDIRSSYDRIILQPRGKHTLKKEVYQLLLNHKSLIESKLATSCDVGNQMKRLKFEIYSGYRDVENGVLNPKYIDVLQNHLAVALGELRISLQPLLASFPPVELRDTRNLISF